MSRIYIVEDDENIRDLVLYALQNSGFEVQGFVSSVGFFQAIQEERCDLVLLDVMLPQESGFDVLKRMKQSELRTIPVVMLTAKSQEFDKIRGLDGGADDYITSLFR